MPDQTEDDENLREMREWHAATPEYTRRLVPASDAEIASVARALWEDPKIRAIFERVGLHGDETPEERAAVDALIDARRTGPLWDRDELHLALASVLARQLAAGVISSFDSPEAKAFLADRRVKRLGYGVVPSRTYVGEVLALAKAMRADPQIWSVISQIDTRTGATNIQGGAINKYLLNYRRKYGLYNRDMGEQMHAYHVLIGLRDGVIASLDLSEAKKILKTNPRILPDA
jgi:hypothetical protein